MGEECMSLWAHASPMTPPSQLVSSRAGDYCICQRLTLLSHESHWITRRGISLHMSGERAKMYLVLVFLLVDVGCGGKCMRGTRSRTRTCLNASDRANKQCYGYQRIEGSHPLILGQCMLWMMMFNTPY